MTALATSMAAGGTAWLERGQGDRVAICGNLALGRVPPNDVVLQDERVSRRHAIIHAQGEEEFWLVDHGSRNGTFVNDRRVLQPFRLRDGDRIRIGPFTLTFRQPGSEPMTVSTERAALRTLVDLQSATCWLLVADVEGSTHLGQSLSQEEVAMLFGGWFQRCEEIIESQGGTVNKYLGDGFLAFWKAAGTSAAAIARVMGELRELQALGRPRFRFVLHCGEILLGGGGTLGEDSLSGAAVNFVFRMEKLAGSLGEGCLLSEAARAGIGEALEARAGGEHPVPGFEGRHRFYAF